MIFNSLKYIRPVWYFNLAKLKGKNIFPNPRELPEQFQNLISYDSSYISTNSMMRDASWQIFQKGYINDDVPSLNFNETIPLIDEYRFIRKYHKPLWANYCFLIRIITLKNPIKEFKAWSKTREVKQVKVFDSPIDYGKWNDFQSDLLKSNPKVSVIIPTLNRYEYLKDGLKDLEVQDYKNFDVIIIDQSEPFNKDFYNEFDLNLQIKHQEEKALWLARNRAIKVSDADYYLLYDDDSRVSPDWISNHIKGLDFFNADISSGQSISKIEEKLPVNYRYFRVSDLLDTGNVMIKKKVFESIGMFDRQFEGQRMGDGEFGLRSYLNGFLNISNPYATRLHLKVGTGGLRQMGSWDAFRPKNFLAAKPIPSVLYLYRKYFGTQLTLFALVKLLPPSIMPYRFKKNKKMLFIGVFISILIFPLVIFQVSKSWRLASIKLSEGAKVEKI